MITVFVAVFGFVLEPTASAGDPKPCKGFDVRQDLFGGGTAVTAKISNVLLEYTGGKAHMSVTMGADGAVHSATPAGTQVPFLLADGTILIFSLDTDSTSQGYVSNTSSVMTNLTYAFPVNNDQLRHLSTSPVTTVRIPYPLGETGDWLPAKNVQAKLQAAALCVVGFAPTDAP